MSNHCKLLVLGLLLVAGCLPLAAQTYTLQPFNYPNMEYTRAYGINNRGAIVGTVALSRGFKRDANGVFEHPIDASSVPPPLRTGPRGINDYGVIVGYYDTAYDNKQYPRTGFLLYHGVFTFYNAQPGWNTVIWGINNKGDFVGSADVVVRMRQYHYGFVNLNGVASKIHCPGDAVGTLPYGIGADGTIVGSCYQNNVTVGFIRGPAGRYKFLRVPGAETTIAMAINNAAHKIVGSYYSPTGVWHGFVYDYITDIITTVDWPGASYTEIHGINSEGVIVGWTYSNSFIGTPQ